MNGTYQGGSRQKEREPVQRPIQQSPIPERVKLIASMAATLYASYRISDARLIRKAQMDCIREAMLILQEVEKIYKVK